MVQKKKIPVTEQKKHHTNKQNKRMQSMNSRSSTLQTTTKGTKEKNPILSQMVFFQEFKFIIFALTISFAFE